MGTKDWYIPAIDFVDVLEPIDSVTLESLEPTLNLKEPPPLELNCTVPFTLELLEFLLGDYRDMFEE